MQEDNEGLPELASDLDEPHSGLGPNGHLQPYLTSPFAGPELLGLVGQLLD